MFCYHCYFQGKQFAFVQIILSVCLSLFFLGSLSLAEKKVNQYLATGSIGQNVPSTHTSHDAREQQQEGNHDSNQQGQDKNTKRDHKEGKERDHRAEVSVLYVFG